MQDRIDTITVNGRPVQASAGTRLIDVLRHQGIDVPTLCHDDRLAPHAGCRLCVVSRRDGKGGLIPSCATPVCSGMVVETDSHEVIAARRRQLQLLALNHRMECPVCDRRGDCRLQDLIFRYGTPEPALPFELVRYPVDDASPVISRDQEKCILCGRCVRLCDEVQGVAAISVMHRGLHARVATLLERELDCEFCGQCVNACPTSALSARAHLGQAPIHLRMAATTTCGYCSCGCQLICEVYEGRLQRVRSDPDSSPNRGKLCAKGWLGQDIHHSPERLTMPLVRRAGKLVETSWNEALDIAAAALARARDTERPILGIGSARLTTEDAYQMQYLLRAVLGSPHVGAGVSGGRHGLVAGLAPATGRPRSSATFDDLAAADVVVVLRADPTNTHPLIKTELMQGIRQRRQQVVLASALSGGLGCHATLDLYLAPATETALLCGTGRSLLRSRPALAAAASGTAGYGDWARSVEDYTAERVMAITGLAPAAIESLAMILEQAGSIVFVVVCAPGIPGSEADVASAAANLAALLDEGGRRRTGVLILGDKANTQGVIDAGLDPEFLPGARPLGDATARSAVEAIWGVAPPAGPGWSSAEAVERAATGQVELLYLVGQDPETLWPDRAQARRMIENAEFAIIQDAFLTAAAAKADVVLPVAILAERAGTLVGADGGSRALQALLPAPGGAPQDGQVFAELARRIGASVPENRELAEQLSALLDTPWNDGACTRFLPAPPLPKASPTPNLRFLFATAPHLFHSGSMTRHAERLCELSPLDALRMAPADLDRLRIGPGGEVSVRVGDAELLFLARADRGQRPGTVAAIRHGRAPGMTNVLEMLDRNPWVEIRRAK